MLYAHGSRYSIIPPGVGEFLYGHYIKIIFPAGNRYDIIVKRMKKLLTCFFALIISAPTAFAADGVTASRVIPSAKDTSSGDSARVAAPRTTVARTAASAASDGGGAPANTVRAGSRVINLDNNTSGASASRGRDTTNAAQRTAVASRGAAGATSARSNLDATVNTVGRNARVEAASINSNPSVRRAGLTLRPSTAEVGGRATIAGTGMQTGSNLNQGTRTVQSRAAATVNAETIAAAKERLEQTAELNKSCQEQYNDCMDQFCAVIDANQKRCSCSANLSKYTKVEEAVNDANTQLNEVAQRIRYVGLSADEIRAIMTATEAEEALTGATDNTETRNMLDEIENLIRDPSSATSYAADTYNGLDLDLDFSSDSGDIFNLDFLNTNSSSSFSNLRGAELYNAAKKRCNTVLNQCKSAGATPQQITGNYDLAIDKDCIAYEQGLSKMNETLVSNVRSANRMLQKARLAVLQNKNQYDAKGCIAALNTCMTDEMVCGADYTKCLDPTKIYIDENGKVVLGQNITKITSFMEAYDNSKIDSASLGTAYSSSMTADSCAGTGNDGRCVIKYLLQKIGTRQKVTDEGLCRAVLDKCQRYTYDSNGNYSPYNDVVVNYIQRAMVNIRSAQQKIISDYASSCMVDVAACYNQQVTQVNAWSSSANAASIQAVMRGACRNVALTCGYAIFDGPPVISNSENTVQGCTYVTQDCTGANNTDACRNNAYIACISDMFYQSLLCPENSTYNPDGTKVDANGTAAGWVNSRCKCRAGYTVWGGACLVDCAADETRNSYGTCQKKAAGSN